MGSIFLAEKTYLGRVLGAVVIVAGLYMVVCGDEVITINSSDEV
ncbi:hypothetical protein HanRHA438_Chr11g0525911 [Helianthus annuus]|nr:hypothetical protein HanXRQr2_Chr11g0513951 [Helianthus annuus]KAJ0503196.1 hypothetical protein HanHA300_Chr11g0421571 [Helianthus annuus]KAJ0519163.1 hypothetical protein HanHA89_Chr11g0445711 [Helianthus annuus]KAJ0690957.1 hypothetical protein HanOQP8_Chr11g0423741 [Helianthus annuus]KAJ0872621.1 hypothetical protein HanRHA438_Chr11g0525911 [Helianthus annuus]